MQAHLNTLGIPLSSDDKHHIQRIEARPNAQNLSHQLKSLITEGLNAKDEKAKAIVSEKKNKLLSDTKSLYNAFAHLGEIADQKNNENLLRIASVGASGAEFFSAGVQLLLNPANPLTSLEPISLAVKSFITIVGILKSKKKNKSESSSPLHAYFEALFKEIRFISEQINAMHKDLWEMHKDMWELHKETRELFAKTFENQKMMLEIICEGFSSLEHKMDSHQVELKDKINQLSIFIKNGFKLLSNDLQVVSLEKFRDLLDDADARLKFRQVTNQAAAIEKITDKLFRWVKSQGKASSPFYTGEKWLPENTREMEAWLNEEVFNNNSLSIQFIIGLLVEYYSQFLKIDLPEKGSIFNTFIGNAATLKYIELANQFGEYIPNPKLHFSEMIDSYNNVLILLKSFQTTPQLYAALFDTYENILREIQQTIDQSIQVQNQTLNRNVLERNKHQPTVAFEIEKSFDTAKWKDQTPTLSPLISCPYGPNGDFRSELDYKDPNIENIVRNFVVLERLGLGTVTFVYDARHHQYGVELNIYIDFIDAKNQTHRLLCLTRGLVNKYASTPYSAVLLAYILQSTAWGKDEQGNFSQSVQIFANIQFAINTIEEHILAQRKLAIQHAIQKLEPLLHKLDYIINVIKSTMEIAGFKQTEMQLLKHDNNRIWNSARLLSHLRQYCEHANINTPLPHAIFLVDSIRNEILSKVNSSSTGYFNSAVYLDTDFIRKALLLMAHNQQMYMEQKKSQISSSVNQIFSYNEALYKRLWTCKASYINQITPEERDEVYNNIIKNSQDAGNQIEDIKKDLGNKQITSELIQKIITLIETLRTINRDLKICSAPYRTQFNDPDAFPFSDHITKLKSFISTLKSESTNTPNKNPYTQLSLPGENSNRLNLILNKQVMRAKLDGNPIYFKRIPNNGTDSKNTVPGSCGYIACGTTREEVGKVLADNFDDHKVKNFIGVQIDNDYKEGSLKIDEKSLSQIKHLSNQLSAKQEKDVNIRKFFLNMLGIKESKSASELINEYKKLSNNPLPLAVVNQLSHHLQMKTDSNVQLIDSVITQIQTADAELKKAEQEYNHFILNSDTIRNYLNANLQTEWMGMGIAAAWAMLTNNTLRVWCINTQPKLNQEDPDDLYFLERGSFIVPDQKLNKSDIHIIHTGNHFEKLQCVPASPLQNNANTTGSVAMQGIFAGQKTSPNAPLVTSSALKNTVS